MGKRVESYTETMEEVTRPTRWGMETVMRPVVKPNYKETGTFRGDLSIDKMVKRFSGPKSRR